MSFTTLVGAFPIAAQGEALEPQPHAQVGELHGSSRSGAFHDTMRDLLRALPGHEGLRFLTHDREAAVTHGTDAHTLWTVLDAQTLPPVIAALDSLLIGCRDRAAAVAPAVRFGADTLDAAQLGAALAAAQAGSQLNAEVPGGDDGDTAEFALSMLASLRALLARAQTHGVRVAVFTWMPG